MADTALKFRRNLPVKPDMSMAGDMDYFQSGAQVPMVRLL